MISLKNYISSTPKRLYDSGASFIKNHPVLTLTATALTSTAALAYFSSDFSAFIRNLPQPPLSVSSFSKPESKINSDKSIFFNKITTKTEYNQIENPTLYGQVVNYIKTGTFADIKITPHTHSFSEKYEFSILGNLLYYPIYSTACAITGIVSALAIHGPGGNSGRDVTIKILSTVFLGAAAGSFGLDQLRERFLGV